MTDDMRAKIAELRRLEADRSEDMEFIVLSSSLAPLLATEVERLTAENERLRHKYEFDADPNAKSWE